MKAATLENSASDSLFFSNCQGENGEACAIFAGPFTVTHHKSTLLIAGMFSFMNAGSGSNQSNHMYKLGPIHQGALERGAKTSSDSYILWPARIGAFSLVMGRHVNHPDTSDLPFSYLIEEQNTTYLIPGVNLRSVGTIRDAQKWPKRDGRHDPHKLDQINYNLLSPYTIQKMMKGREILKELQKVSGETSVGTIAAYEVSPVMMDVFGLEQPLYFQYLNRQLRYGYRSCTGGKTILWNGTVADSLTPQQERWRNNHWLLQYDLMFGEGYALDRMGISLEENG